MMPAYHYMQFYHWAYGINQWLADQGYIVMSVNYRLGIGYGRVYQHPEHSGPAGASEYQDVLSGARFLQSVKGVDPTRIGIWGGSYGGFPTAIALARNSDVFKALVFLLRLAHGRTSGRPKSRAFVEFLFVQFPEQESAVLAPQDAGGRITVP